MVIYRGQADKNWNLDCTFIRNVKHQLLGVRPKVNLTRECQHSSYYQRLLGSLLLDKFGSRTMPAAELLGLADSHRIDPWFEYMKGIQQYPEKDMDGIKGSFLVDWSYDEKVALYFANDCGHQNELEGAVWIADVTAMGPVLLRDKTVKDILMLYRSRLSMNMAMGIPLVFEPKIRVGYDRANNQKALYVAQMDLRFDLQEAWRDLEDARGLEEIILLKLVLPKQSRNECTQWLESHGTCESYIFPDNRKCLEV